jgi:hypothetical protein
MRPLNDISLLEEAQYLAKKLNPFVCAGYLVQDAKFNTMEIKCPSYVALVSLGFNSSIYLFD